MKTLLLATTLLATALNAQVHCKFEHGSTTCGPVLLGAHHVTHAHKHVLTFSTTHAPRSTHGLLAFGVQSIKVRFPGTNCFLLVQPLIVVLYAANAHGEARTSFKVTNPKGTIIAQSAFPDHGLPRTSNSLKVTCQ